MRYNNRVKYCFPILVCLILFCACEDNRPVAGTYPVTGYASWYNSQFVASGENYHENELTSAMRKREFGKYYLVCNLENNKCAVAKHNDFGPSLNLFKKGRIIDLSRFAFFKVADLRKGVIRVRIGEIHAGKVD